MEEIKVGEYVRTNDGLIEIVEENLGYRGFLYHCVCYKTDRENALEERAIVKHSPNIIDLIELGDYVNGEKVLQTQCKLEYIDDDSDTGVNEVDDGLELEKGWIYFEHEIKTILTKEQYKANCYEV